MKAQPNLMSLQEASEAVRTFSGDYPVCLVTSYRGAAIIKPILEDCHYRLNGVEVRLMIDEGCKKDTVYFLRQMDLDIFMKSRRSH